MRFALFINHCGALQDENYYSAFLSAHGGSSNAFTAEEVNREFVTKREESQSRAVPLGTVWRAEHQLFFRRGAPAPGGGARHFRAVLHFAAHDRGRHRPRNAGEPEPEGRCACAPVLFRVLQSGPVIFGSLLKPFVLHASAPRGLGASPCSLALSTAPFVLAC